jgi:integrase
MSGYGDGSDYQDKHGQWWAKFPLGNGRNRRKRCADRKEAKATLAAWRRARDAGLNVDAARQPVATWLAFWLTTRKGVVKDSTYAFYARHAGYAAAYLGTVALEDLTPAHVDSMTATMRREGVAPQTIRHTKTALSMALKKAANANIIHANPAAASERVRVERYRPHELTPAEADALLRAVEGDRRALAVHLALFLGPRRGEVLTFRWGDVDWKAGTLTVKEGKTPDARRVLPLPPALQERLRAHFTAQAEERVVAPRWREHGLILPSEAGTPISGRNLTRWFKAMLVKAGLPERVRFHDLRHYAISEWYAAGADPKTVQALAGHADPALSQKVYAHARPEQLRAAVEGAEKRRRQG